MKLEVGFMTRSTDRCWLHIPSKEMHSYIVCGCSSLRIMLIMEPRSSKVMFNDVDLQTLMVC